MVGDLRRRGTHSRRGDSRGGEGGERQGGHAQPVAATTPLPPALRGRGAGARGFRLPESGRCSLSQRASSPSPLTPLPRKAGGEGNLIAPLASPAFARCPIVSV